MKWNVTYPHKRRIRFIIINKYSIITNNFPMLFDPKKLKMKIWGYTKDYHVVEKESGVLDTISLWFYNL